MLGVLSLAVQGVGLISGIATLEQYGSGMLQNYRDEKRFYEESKEEKEHLEKAFKILAEQLDIDMPTQEDIKMLADSIGLGYVETGRMLLGLMENGISELDATMSIDHLTKLYENSGVLSEEQVAGRMTILNNSFEDGIVTLQELEAIFDDTDGLNRMIEASGIEKEDFKKAIEDGYFNNESFFYYLNEMGEKLNEAFYDGDMTNKQRYNIENNGMLGIRDDFNWDQVAKYEAMTPEERYNSGISSTALSYFKENGLNHRIVGADFIETDESDDEIIDFFNGEIKQSYEKSKPINNILTKLFLDKAVQSYDDDMNFANYYENNEVSSLSIDSSGQSKIFLDSNQFSSLILDKSNISGLGMDEDSIILINEMNETLNMMAENFESMLSSEEDRFGNRLIAYKGFEDNFKIAFSEMLIDFSTEFSNELSEISSEFLKQFTRGYTENGYALENFSGIYNIGEENIALANIQRNIDIIYNSNGILLEEIKNNINEMSNGKTLESVIHSISSLELVVLRLVDQVISQNNKQNSVTAEEVKAIFDNCMNELAEYIHLNC